MSYPEEIPEDREESYPCPDEECQGTVTSNGKRWECNECSFWSVDNRAVERKIRREMHG
jgi:hypothetical protein